MSRHRHPMPRMSGKNKENVKMSGNGNDALSQYFDGISVDEEVDGILKPLREKMLRDKGRIRTLLEENAELHSAAYKDAELRKVTAVAKRIQADASRGFPITEEEEKAIREWQEKHELEAHGIQPGEAWKSSGAIGGRYSYTFLPTSIGVSGTVKCFCGEEFEFSEIG